MRRKNFKGIRIFSPASIPFGPLSNNAEFPMIIDGDSWRTVTNYVYASMLTTPIYKLKVQRAHVKGSTKNVEAEEKIKTMISAVSLEQKRTLTEQEEENIRRAIYEEISLSKMSLSQLYNYYLHEEKVAIQRDACDKYYQALVNDERYQGLKQILLNSGNGKIFYQSNNPDLGTGNDNRGRNIIGESLTQLRHNVYLENVERNRQWYENIVYMIYKAFRIMFKELMNGDTLAKYQGVKLADIVAEYEKYNKEEVPEKKSGHYSDYVLYDKETVLALFNAKAPDVEYIAMELQNEGFLLPYVRKIGLKKLNDKLEQERRDVVWQEYTRYFIAQKFPNLPKEDSQKAIDHFVLTIPIDFSVESDTPEIKQQILDEITKIVQKQEISEKIVQQDPETYKEIISQEYTDKKSNQILSNEAIQEMVRKLNGVKIFCRKLRMEQYKEKVNDAYNKNKMAPEAVVMISEKLEKIEKIPKDILDAAENMEMSANEEEGEINGVKATSSSSSQSFFDFDGGPLKKVEEATGIVADKIKQIPGYKKFLDFFDDKKDVKDEWIVRVKIKNPSYTSDIYKGTQEPTKRFLEELVEKFNAEHKRMKIGINNLVYKKVPKVQEEIKTPPENVEFKGDFGPPVAFQATDEKNVLYPFSPLFGSNITVDNFLYRDLAEYITVRLVAHTSYNSIKLSTESKRGISIEKAREMVVGKENIDEIIDTKMKEDHSDCLEIFVEKAMDKKFSKNQELVSLLLLTGEKNILWDDPDDEFLGGEMNIVGKYLEQIREKYRPKVSFFPFFSDKKTNTVEQEQVLKFVKTNGFIKQWIGVKLRDMCSTVGKMKNYLLKNNISEKITDVFTDFTLKTFYPRCEGKFIRYNITMPDFFREIVSSANCLEFPQEINETKEKLQELIEKRDRFMEEFEGVRKHQEKKEEINVKEIVENLMKDYVEISREQKDGKVYSEPPGRRRQRPGLAVPEPTAEEDAILKRNERIKKQIENLFKNMNIEREIDVFEKNERIEWEKFIASVLEPKLSPEEIQERKKKCLDVYNKSLSNATSILETEKKKANGNLESIVEAMEKFEKYKKTSDETKSECLRKLVEPKNDIKTINRLTREFLQRQEQARNRKFGRKEKTREEEIRYEQALEEIMAKISEYKKSLAKANESIDILYNGIATVYWHRILSMIVTVILEMDNPTEEKVNKFIVDAMEFTMADYECKQDILPQKWPNCIAIAICKVLVCLRKFKKVYHNVPLDAKDIDQAVIILINKSIPENVDALIEADKKEYNKEYEEEQEQEAPDNFAEQEPDEDIGLGPLGPDDEEPALSVEDSAVEKVSSAQTDVVALSEKEDEEALSNPMEKFFEFGMKGNPGDEIVKIIKILLDIDPEIKDVNDVASRFMSAVKFVKYAKIPTNVKKSRVNFFASF